METVSTADNILIETRAELVQPSRVYGVDFSGGKDAGRKIWIAGGVVEGETLRLETCKRASTLPESGRQRELALAALQTFVRQQAPCVVGLDFPFGLPSILVDTEYWKDFALDLGDRYPEADVFQKSCRQMAIARDGRKELRRVTDVNAKTPFAPYNLRLYRQTYYGIRDVLAPLVRSGAASVLPMQPPVAGHVWLLEICPASTLKQMDLYQKYKGAKLAEVRDAILSGLKRHMSLVVPESVRSEVLADKEGDALDSVIAAVATFRALRGSIDCSDNGPSSLIEGHVYV